jgi:uncharacterized RDD family membrane protein YckC
MKVKTGTRLLNFLLDLLAIYIISVLVLKFFHVDDDKYLFAVTIIVYFIYYFFLEATFGATIGKMIPRTKVVSTDGKDVPAHICITRTLIRTIPILNLFDAISFLHTEKDGLHDRWTGTKLINKVFK